jgi:hypothetical protein
MIGKPFFSQELLVCIEKLQQQRKQALTGVLNFSLARGRYEFVACDVR